MATIDEIFDAMADEAAEAGHEYLVIDPETRIITVPESERIFGVTGDELADRKYFMCPRYVGDNLDLAGMFLTVYFRTATEYEDGYLVDDVAVKGDYVTFSWLLQPSVTAYKGKVQFTVCADLPNTAEKRRPDWNTTLAEGEVLEGLDPDVGDVEAETSDVVSQLREMVTAQTAAVEAAGTDQVDVVEAAGAAATADAQAQIEAKGAATLATIPADYTTLANKTNEQANAIKGLLAGEIVQAGDVSPVEHYLGVKVHGKNLFNIGALEIMPASYTTRISAIDTENNAFTITTVDIHAGNGYCGLTNAEGNYVTTLRDLCPHMVAGKTYVLSGTTESHSRSIYLRGVSKAWVFGTSLEITEEHLSAKVAMYGLDSAGGEGTGDCVISNIQIEEGTVATEYTPYIDPAGVTVTRCGKNMLPHPYDGTIYSNGVTFTANADGSITLNGTNNGESNSVFYITKDKYTAIAKGEYTGNLGAAGVTLMGVIKGGGYKTLSDYFKLSESIELRSIYLQITKGSTVTFDNVTVYPQLELGTTATEYEPYNGVTAMPDESGAVTGLPSLAPAMTLLTDTPGVNIECTYNRDSNAVYAELLAKIAALSGAN